MARFVLVHGSWHDGGAWRSVAERLTHAGHESIAPTLAGHGPGASRDVRFADYVAGLVQDVDASGWNDIVLVGHSLGGAVAAAAAGLLENRIARLLFIAAIIPRHGERLADIVPPESAAAFKALAADSPDNSIVLPWPLWRERFMGEADIATARRAYECLSPEPYRPVEEAIDMNGFDLLAIERSYIHCRADVVFPPGDWHFFPRFFNRLGIARFVEVDAGHEAMLTAPGALTAAILTAARE